MDGRPVTEISRPLTDAERQLMCRLAVQVVAAQTGRDGGTVADELDELELVLHGDSKDAYLEACGQVLVHVERDWLAFHAARFPGYDPMRDARPIPRERP